jgi:hypothetical protein
LDSGRSVWSDSTDLNPSLDIFAAVCTPTSNNNLTTSLPLTHSTPYPIFV